MTRKPFLASMILMIAHATPAAGGHESHSVHDDVNELGALHHDEAPMLHHHDDGGEAIHGVFERLARLDARRHKVAKALDRHDTGTMGMSFDDPELAPTPAPFVKQHSPKFSTDEQLRAIPYNDKERSLALANRNLAEGTKVGVRLNLNLLGRTKGAHAVQSVHAGSWSGKVVGYDGHVTLKNPKFSVSQPARANIAAGRASKSPMASVDGGIQHHGHSLEGVEVRFNPKTSHLFTRADNGWAVKSCDEATVHGHRAYCRGNIEYWKEHEAPQPLEGLHSDVQYKPGGALTKAVGQHYPPHDGTEHPLESAARQLLGTTKKAGSAGYVLRDGSMLSFDPGNTGAKTLDHSLSPAHHDMGLSHLGANDRVQHFMHHTGAARVSFDEDGHIVSAMHPLTREQHATLSRHILPGDHLQVEAVGHPGQAWSHFYADREIERPAHRDNLLDSLQFHTSINPEGGFSKAIDKKDRATLGMDFDAPAEIPEPDDYGPSSFDKTEPRTKTHADSWFGKDKAPTGTRSSRRREKAFDNLLSRTTSGSGSSASTAAWLNSGGTPAPKVDFVPPSYESPVTLIKNEHASPADVPAHTRVMSPYDWMKVTPSARSLAAGGWQESLPKGRPTVLENGGAHGTVLNTVHLHVPERLETADDEPAANIHLPTASHWEIRNAARQLHEYYHRHLSAAQHGWESRLPKAEAAERDLATLHLYLHGADTPHSMPGILHDPDWIGRGRRAPANWIQKANLLLEWDEEVFSKAMDKRDRHTIPMDFTTRPRAPRPNVDDEVEGYEQGLLPVHRISADAYAKHAAKDWRIGDTMRYTSGKRYARGGHVEDTGEYPVVYVEGGRLRINHPTDDRKIVSFGEATRVHSSFDPESARGAHIGAVAAALKHGKEVPLHVLEDHQENMKAWEKRRGVPMPQQFVDDLAAGFAKHGITMSKAIDPLDRHTKRLFDTTPSAGQVPVSLGHREQIHHPAFKSWFGDWEKRDGNHSKVVHPDGRPMPVFHGTAHSFDSFDPSTDASRDPRKKGPNLYGDGFYFASNPDTAKNYQISGVNNLEHSDIKPDASHFQRVASARKEALQHLKANPAYYQRVTKKRPYDPNPDAPAHGSPEFHQQVQSVQDALAHHDTLPPGDHPLPVGNHVARAINAHVQKQVPLPLPEGNRYAVHLNIRNPLRINDDVLPRHEREKIHQSAIALDTAGTTGTNRDPAYLTHKHAQLHPDLEYSAKHVEKVFGGRNDINHLARHAGYDGINYQGGDIGADKDHHNQTWVAFHPHQIKHVDNEGTFSPHETNMYKALGEAGDVVYRGSDHDPMNPGTFSGIFTSRNPEEAEQWGKLHKLRLTKEQRVLHHGTPEAQRVLADFHASHPDGMWDEEDSPFAFPDHDWARHLRKHGYTATTHGGGDLCIFNPSHLEHYPEPITKAGTADSARAARIANSLDSGRKVRMKLEHLPHVLDHAWQNSHTFDLAGASVAGTKLFRGHKGIERKDMPQIPSEHHGAFLAGLTADGIDYEEGHSDPKQFAPTQSQLDARNSGGLLAAMREGKYKSNRPIFVSSDDHVLDGHHRWVAGVAYSAENPGYKMPTTRINLPIHHLLQRVNDFNAKHGIEAQGFGDLRVSGVEHPAPVTKAIDRRGGAQNLSMDDLLDATDRKHVEGAPWGHPGGGGGTGRQVAPIAPPATPARSPKPRMPAPNLHDDVKTEGTSLPWKSPNLPNVLAPLPELRSNLDTPKPSQPRAPRQGVPSEAMKKAFHADLDEALKGVPEKHPLRQNIGQSMRTEFEKGDPKHYLNNAHQLLNQMMAIRTMDRWEPGINGNPYHKVNQVAHRHLAKLLTDAPVEPTSAKAKRVTEDMERQQMAEMHPHETMTVIGHDGKVHGQFTQHHQSQVEFSPGEMDKIRQVPGGAILTHNHPHGLRFTSDDPSFAGTSFSREDLHHAGQAFARETRVVTPKHTYVLRPGVNGNRFTPQLANRMWNEHENAYVESYRPLREAVLRGDMSAGEAHNLASHLAMKLLAHRMGLEYEQTPHNHTPAKDWYGYSKGQTS